MKKKSKTPTLPKRKCKTQTGGNIPEEHNQNNNNMLWIILLVLIFVISTMILQNNRLTEKIINNTINTHHNKKNIKTKEDYVSELEDEENNKHHNTNRQPGYVGYRTVGPNADNINDISYSKYIQMKNYDRVINPLLPPERSYENTYGIPINIPSRGFSGGYQQIGMLYKDDIISEDSRVGQNSNSVIIPLYGRPTYPGSNKWNYYITSDKFHAVKMPITVKGKSSDDTHGVDEIYDKDNLQVPAYNGNFIVKIYNYDKPRYIPYVL